MNFSVVCKGKPCKKIEKVYRTYFYKTRLSAVKQKVGLVQSNNLKRIYSEGLCCKLRAFRSSYWLTTIVISNLPSRN